MQNKTKQNKTINMTSSLEICYEETFKMSIFKIFIFKIFLWIFIPSCKKVIIEGNNISSLVRKEYD